MALPRITSPHAKGSNRTQQVMLQVLLATVPGILALTWLFGAGTLFNLLWASLCALGFEAALERAGLTCNKNAIPFDPEKPFVTSGIRLGSSAGTTRGFGEEEFRQIGRWIVEVVDGLAANGPDDNAEVEARVAGEVKALCARFPLYEGL